MKNKKKSSEITKSEKNYIETYIGKKVVQKSLDSAINFDLVDNAKAYYSERYGWTLRKI
ncbi:hypothetical protein IDH28_02700 [Pelagibacterales bacterium SAG-MED31]|nr:hypothetical protein [Pelagibacterales bacterium SAG-MED31]